MKRSLSLFLLGMLCAILVAGLGFAPAGATRPSSWAPDARVPGYLDDTFTPFLLADRNRTVHAFASQWVENEGRRLAIVYRQWTLWAVGHALWIFSSPRSAAMPISWVRTWIHPIRCT